MSEATLNAAAAERGRRVALLVEYDGERFAGSQLQPNAPTVQAELEAAILKTTQETSRVAFAGRTDAGVHARGQVAAFSTASGLDAATLVRALNAWSPPDVAVRAASDVPPGFDPRRDARGRWYRYHIVTQATKPALERSRAWHVPGPLDVEAMARAACSLFGEHDFAAFASRLEDEGASTVRRLDRFEVTANGHALTIDVEANAFLPHQVRRMTGALVQVGAGKLDPDAYAALVDGTPGSAGPTAPPHGLYLMAVHYEAPIFSLDSTNSVC